MSEMKNSPLPITKYGNRGIQVPLQEAINNPSSVMRTTPKTYLPPPANQMPAPKK